MHHREMTTQNPGTVGGPLLGMTFKMKGYLSNTFSQSPRLNNAFSHLKHLCRNNRGKQLHPSLSTSVSVISLICLIKMAGRLDLKRKYRLAQAPYRKRAGKRKQFLL